MATMTQPQKCLPHKFVAPKNAMNRTLQSESGCVLRTCRTWSPEPNNAVSIMNAMPKDVLHHNFHHRETIDQENKRMSSSRAGATITCTRSVCSSWLDPPPAAKKTARVMISSPRHCDVYANTDEWSKRRQETAVGMRPTD